MRLPGSVQAVADVIGVEQALSLVGLMPGFRNASKGGYQRAMYVPSRAKLTPDHELVRILGWTDALSLVVAFGGEVIQLASCAEIYRRFRDQAIVRMHGDGLKVADIAEMMGVCDRVVRNLIREKPQVEQSPANDNTPPHAQTKPVHRLRTSYPA